MAMALPSADVWLVVPQTNEFPQTREYPLSVPVPQTRLVGAITDVPANTPVPQTTVLAVPQTTELSIRIETFPKGSIAAVGERAE